MKLTHTFRRRKNTRIERTSKEGRPARHETSWERARYEQAPEMIGHMLHVR